MGEACTKQCTTGGLGAYHPSCKPTPVKPADASETYWFPEVLNAKIQDYFNDVLPRDAQKPTAVWSGVREDMAVPLANDTLDAKFLSYSDEGWMYLECGEAQNWISM